MHNPYLDLIIISVLTGNLKEAKADLQVECKTKPEEQAYRLAVITSRLILDHDETDLAFQFMCMFDN